MVNLQIIQAREFLRATPEGVLDFAESKRVLEEIAAVAGMGDHQIVLDVREIDPRATMSVVDLWNLAAMMGEHGKAFHRKIAVICPVERFDKTAFFALCAENRGFQVKAFTVFEEAFNWLTQPDSSGSDAS